MGTRVIANSICAIIALTISCQSAQAMLLSGQIDTSEAPEPAPAPVGQPGMPLQNQQPRSDQVKPQPPARPVAKPVTNTFPLTFQGAWYCETTVVDSTLPAVTQGQVINSEVVFFSGNDGGIHARWNQPGWVETQSQAITFNGNEAKADRTNYYFGDNMKGSWAARARDQFAQTGPDAISAKSYVDQYMDGQYLGRYRTVSVLKRTGAPQNMASMN